MHDCLLFRSDDSRCTRRSCQLAASACARASTIVKQKWLCSAGSHAKHNEATGDNAGPCVLKSLGGDGAKKDEGKKAEAKKEEGAVEPLMDGLKV